MQADPIWVIVRERGLHYGGRELQAGDLVRMAPLDAVRAHKAGLISLTRPAQSAIARAMAGPSLALGEYQPTPRPELALEAERPGKKRRYKRRDLEAEP